MIGTYNIDECGFYDCGNTYATLRDKNFKICEFETKELANEFLKEIQKRGDDCIQTLAYQYLDRNWIEIYAFKGKFFNNWQIILQMANNFFGKKISNVNFYL